MKTLNPLAETYEWFVRAVPKPTEKNLAVQTGVHVEEVVEFLSELRTADLELLSRTTAAIKAMHELGEYLKTQTTSISFPNRIETLDAICDQLVTTTGVAWMLNIDPVGGLAEVNRSNWSKFVNGLPQFDANGKIMKAGDYTKPNLQPFA